MGVFATGDLGSLPAPAFGLSVGGGITLWRVRIDLTGTYWFEQEATLDDSAKGGNFSFFSAALAGCPILLPGDLELGVCAGLELGRMHAEGFGVTDPSESSILWAAFRAGGAASWVFADPVALRLQIDMVVPFTRPQWVLQNVGAIDQPGSVTGRALLGSELRF